MGIADVAKSSKIKTDTTWITPGDYLLRVTELKEIEKPGKLLFISNFDVVESKGEQAIPAGRDTSFCVDCLKFEGAFAGDVVKFFAALNGLEVDDIDEDGINAGVSPEQPFAGLLISAQAWNHTTGGGAVITKVKFFNVEEQEN